MPGACRNVKRRSGKLLKSCLSDNVQKEAWMVALTLCVWKMGQRLRMWLGSLVLAPHLHVSDSGGSFGQNLLAYEPVNA